MHLYVFWKLQMNTIYKQLLGYFYWLCDPPLHLKNHHYPISSHQKWENRGKMTKLCKNDNFEGFFKGNLEANLGTYDPF